MRKHIGLQGANAVWRPLVNHIFPSAKQLLLVQLGPGLDKSLLPPRQATFENFYSIDGNGHVGILVHGMKVRSVVRRPAFVEHTNDDSVEARELWHSSFHHIEPF